MEAAHVIAACENRLLAAKIIDRPFSADKIHGGVLKEHLTMEDYQAPLELSTFPSYLILSLQHLNRPSYEFPRARQNSSLSKSLIPLK